MRYFCFWDQINIIARHILINILMRWNFVTYLHLLPTNCSFFTGFIKIHQWEWCISQTVVLCDVIKCYCFKLRLLLENKTNTDRMFSLGASVIKMIGVIWFWFCRCMWNIFMIYGKLMSQYILLEFFCFFVIDTCLDH